MALEPDEAGLSGVFFLKGVSGIQGVEASLWASGCFRNCGVVLGRGCGILDGLLEGFGAREATGFRGSLRGLVFEMTEGRGFSAWPGVWGSGLGKL